MKQYFVSIQLVLLIGWLGGTVISCKKMDDYKKFGEGGEIVYPATFDSLKVIPGNGRVMITGLLAGDPNVTRYKIFWNNGSDSLERTIARHGRIDTLKQIVDRLPEGPMTFTLRTYDDRGNRSIPMTVTGNVYGASFQASVNERGNRAVLNTKFDRNGAAVISWADVDAYVGVLGMRVHYFDANDKERDTIIVVQGKDQQTAIRGVSVTKPILYNTLYLPEAVGVDTFTVASKTLPLFTEVALLNNVKPIANEANDGDRWANLRDWISNDAVKNHNGFGGTDRSSDAKIYFEAGWGAPAITNGKIYQVVTLPPGKYRFHGSIDWYHLSTKNDVWLMAAPGNNGLPNVSELASAFAYKKVENGTWDVSMEFTVTQQIQLSLGLLLDMSDSGEAMRFNSLRLYIVN
ncbi:DUF4998 domain-containing protein [Longitalea arenae]|uniref:DUF4998 domain-containing protein n=1 Tax=Longitalea arenae TaxID=2812558 RepID=UPI001967E2D5|nr:DUF4998 domain-containing protein [Longitalea arenae]